MLRFYGGEDELVVVEFREGVENRWVQLEVYRCFDTAMRFDLRHDTGGGCAVTIAYDGLDSDVWSGKVEQLDEDVPIPWPVQIYTAEPGEGLPATKTGCGFAVVVEVGCPPGTKLEATKIMPGYIHRLKLAD
jgi:hypothetical protein